MEGLHDGYVPLLTGVVNGGRNKWQCIVKMGDLRSIFDQNLRDVIVGFTRPGGSPYQADFFTKRPGVNLIILSSVNRDLVAILFEQLLFRVKNGVFPTRLLVVIMDEKNSHASFSV